MLVLEVLVGAAFGALTVVGARFLARRLAHRGDRVEALLWVLATIALPLIYVAFAGVNHSGDGLRTEAIGVAIFVPLAIFAWRRESPWLVLAIAWALHAGWDSLLHSRATTPYVVGWYPGVCLGTDLVVATYLFWRSRLVAP